MSLGAAEAAAAARPLSVQSEQELQELRLSFLTNAAAVPVDALLRCAELVAHDAALQASFLEVCAHAVCAGVCVRERGMHCPWASHVSGHKHRARRGR
jgi:hypothetical protein